MKSAGCTGIPRETLEAKALTPWVCWCPTVGRSGTPTGAPVGRPQGHVQDAGWARRSHGVGGLKRPRPSTRRCALLLLNEVRRVIGAQQDSAPAGDITLLPHRPRRSDMKATPQQTPHDIDPAPSTILRRHPVAMFFSLTYATAWALWLPRAILQDQMPARAGFVLTLLGSLMPS